MRSWPWKSRDNSPRWEEHKTGSHHWPNATQYNWPFLKDSNRSSEQREMREMERWILFKRPFSLIWVSSCVIANALLPRWLAYTGLCWDCHESPSTKGKSEILILLALGWPKLVREAENENRLENCRGVGDKAGGRSRLFSNRHFAVFSREHLKCNAVCLSALKRGQTKWLWLCLSA